MDFEIIGSDLLFPEGPVTFEDGSCLVVEICRGSITRCWNGRTEVVATPGGGPNGAALGPDGALWVCNNGGFTWTKTDDGLIVVIGGLPEDSEGGRIERIDLSTGKVERVYTSVNGHPLKGPNDIVFDKTGGFWFTDLGKHHGRTRDKSGVYYARPDGSSIQEVIYEGLSYNGVGLSPDGETLYVADTFSGRIWAYPVTAPGQVGAPRVLGAVPGAAMVDSMAVTAAGNVCVGTLGGAASGISTITPAGEVRLTPLPDPYTTNIAFGGPDLRDAYVTLSSRGQLVRMRWDEPGLKINFGS